MDKVIEMVDIRREGNVEVELREGCFGDVGESREKDIYSKCISRGSN
jgi:hypothetical protein